MAMVLLGRRQTVCISKSTQQHAMECPPIAFTSPVGALWGSGRDYVFREAGERSRGLLSPK